MIEEREMDELKNRWMIICELEEILTRLHKIGGENKERIESIEEMLYEMNKELFYEAAKRGLTWYKLITLCEENKEEKGEVM